MTDAPAAAGTLVEPGLLPNVLRGIAHCIPLNCQQCMLQDVAAINQAADALSACRAELARMAKTAADNFESAESAIAAKEQSERLLAASNQLLLETDAALRRATFNVAPTSPLGKLLDRNSAALASKESPK